LSNLLGETLNPTEQANYDSLTAELDSLLSGDPTAVQNLAATAGDAVVYLAWDANTTDPQLAGYDVYRGVAPGSHPDRLRLHHPSRTPRSSTTSRTTTW